MQTLVDLFELNTRAPVSTVCRKARPAGEEGYDWSSSTTESSPGVSIESWRRARGWSTDDD